MGRGRSWPRVARRSGFSQARRTARSLRSERRDSAERESATLVPMTTTISANVDQALAGLQSVEDKVAFIQGLASSDLSDFLRLSNYAAELGGWLAGQGAEQPADRCPRAADDDRLAWFAHALNDTRRPPADAPGELLTLGQHGFNGSLRIENSDRPSDLPE